MSQICFVTPKDTLNYDNNSSLQYRWGHDLLEKTKHLFRDGVSVLDVGCGNGKITQEILKLNNNIESIDGIDGSKPQIELATKNNKSESKIKFIEMNLNEINYVNRYDIVYGCCIFHWIADQKSVFVKLFNSLKNDGIFMFVGPAANEFNISIISEKIARSDKWKEDFVGFNSGRSYHTPEEYNNMLTQIGFEVQEIKETNTKNVYDDVEKLKNWIRPLAIYAKSLPGNDKQEEFIDDIVVEMFNQKLEMEEGKIVMNSIKVEVLCRKI